MIEHRLTNDDIPVELAEKINDCVIYYDGPNVDVAKVVDLLLEADLVAVSPRIVKAREWAAQLADQRKRAENQMTLGQLIARLSELPGDLPMAHLCHPHSYRGYYCDLGLELKDADTRPVADVLKMCKGCVGRKLIGWKGGEFLMHEETPVWISERGVWPGDRLVYVGDDGIITTSTPTLDDDDD